MVSTIKKISGSAKASQQQKALSFKQRQQAAGKFGGPAEAQRVAEGRSTTSVEKIRTEEDVLRQQEGAARAAKRKSFQPVGEEQDLIEPSLQEISPFVPTKEEPQSNISSDDPGFIEKLRTSLFQTEPSDQALKNL